MKLESVDKAPAWLKRDPTSGYFWVVIYRAEKGRLYKTTKERESKNRAVAVGEKIIAKWLGQEITGGARKVYFRDALDEVYANQKLKFERKKLRSGTMEQAKIYFTFLRAEFGNILMRDFTKRHWDQFVALFQKENPGKTLYNHWKHFNQVVSHAHDCGYLEKRIKVENPDPVKRVERVLSEEEKVKLLQVALPDLRDQLLMAMTMGMRLREHLKLSWDRVNLEEKTITLRAEDTKTKRGRVMRMSPQVYAMLLRRSQWVIKRSPFVFPGRLDQSKPTLSNKSAWGTAKRKAGIKGKCKYHLLRHTFLTECAKQVREGGVSVVLVCAYAGLSIKTFERTYLHLNHEDTSPVSNLIAVKLGEMASYDQVNH